MVGFFNQVYHTFTLYLLPFTLVLLLSTGDMPRQMAIAAPAAKPAKAVTPTPPAPPAPVPAPVSAGKEPMIEVSVDALEISESNTDKLGVVWGTPGKDPGSFVLGQLNLFERATMSLLKVGQIDRSIISGQIDALIQNNQARILANPTLLTKSGFEANFLVGGEIPYPTVGQGGVGGVEFKKYGVLLKILPKITPHNTIEAQINVGVSSPDNSVSIKLNNVDVPGLSSREAASKVDVNDGETVVLAGIKQSRREKTIIRVPVLGYIPLLGLLFRNKKEITAQTSLVLFVTFRLVK